MQTLTLHQYDPKQPASHVRVEIEPLSHAEIDDKILIIHMSSGDDRALERFYQRYATRLAAYFSRRLEAQELVDELINDTMMVVWQKASEFDHSKRVSSWLFGIAHNKLLKAWSRPRRHETPIEDIDIPQDCNTEPEALMQAAECRGLVANGLRHLSPDQRLVLELFYFQSYTSREIAAQTGAAEPTVRSRLRLAKQRLAQHFIQRQVVPV